MNQLNPKNTSEITTTNIYKKSLQRFNLTKYQAEQKSSQELIDFLLDFYHDNQTQIKQENQPLTINIPQKQ